MAASGPTSDFDQPIRRHRGDFERSDTLLVGYSDVWRSSLTQMIEAVRNEVEIYLVVGRDESLAGCYDWLRQAKLIRHNVHVLKTNADTPWVRDYGPLQVIDPRLGPTWIDARYSDNRPGDDQLPVELAQRLGASIESLHSIVDGGALISNGAGLCVATSDSVNEFGVHWSHDRDAFRWLDQMGCRCLAVVPALPYEETGHVDMLAQFLEPDLLAVAQMDPAADPHEARLLDSVVETVSSVAAGLGFELRVVRVPIARLGRTYYSYLNGLRVNDTFLVPSFEVVSPGIEAEAFEALAAAMPTAEVIPIAADAMIDLGGALHCVAIALSPLSYGYY